MNTAQGIGKYKVRYVHSANVTMDSVTLLNLPQIIFNVRGREYCIAIFSEEHYPSEMTPVYDLLHKAFKNESTTRYDRTINDLRNAVEVVAKQNKVKGRHHSVCNFKRKVNR